MDDSGITEQRYRIGKKFFIHAPPFKGRRNKETGKFLSKRLERIQVPFHGAEPWQCSIYYFWWEFLRRHKGYKNCCERGGDGDYAQLYADWGDVHQFSTDQFWNWWTEKQEIDGLLIGRGELLFAEPTARRITISDRVESTQNLDTITVNIPLEVRTPQLIHLLRKLLEEQRPRVIAARKISRAMYPVGNPVRLNSLYLALRAWDVWCECRDTKVKKYEMCDLAEIPYNHIVNGETISKLKRLDLPYRDVEKEVRRRQTQAFERYRSAAEDYIESAARGRFPTRYKPS